MRYKFGLAFVVLIFLVTSCYKTPKYSETPAIKFDSYSVTEPYTVGTSGYLRIKFEDGGGDLGRANNSDSTKNCLVTKTKYNSTLEMILPVIPNKGTSSDVSGYIDLSLLSILDETGCIDFGSGSTYHKPYDTTSFQIIIKDRSGHISNTLVTPPLIFKCQ